MSETEKPVEVQIAEMIAQIQALDLKLIASEEKRDRVGSKRIIDERQLLLIQLAKLKDEIIEKPSIWELN